MFEVSSLSRFLLAALMSLALAGCGAASAEPTSWFENGRPDAQALQAVAMLADAASDGLLPEDYQAAALGQQLAAAAQGPALDAERISALNQRLSSAVLHFLGDLQHGRVDPASIHQNFTPPPRAAVDLAALLDQALARHELAELAGRLSPPLPTYARLREALARYRSLVDHPAWQQALPPLPGTRRWQAGKLTPGTSWDGLPMLAERLAALGDADAGDPLPASLRYGEPLAAAVRSFQDRHGLPADGVIGKATLTQLEVTPAARVRQIELTMERLRWTPLLQGPRMIVINIPEFVLRAYEVEDGRIRVDEDMKVIVGKALDTRTPLFDEDMRYIEFSPYWNVPPSIARSELVPRLRRDPAHWTQEGFEFVAGDGAVETRLSNARLDAVLAGSLRIRQRPGPRNALGDIKFVFPNTDNIYLHHTPSVGLFSRERRDFSHGCIRVERPLALAKFVLKGMPDWPEARITEAMTAGTSATMKLAEPVPVVIAYGTALVKHGRLHFFDDLYGHDRLLDAALRQRHAEPQPSALEVETPNPIIERP